MASLVRFISKNAVRALIERYCPRINASVLDVGCGSGKHSHLFASQGIRGRYTGIDIKEDIHWHKNKVKTSELEVSFKIHDAESLETLNQQFNFIYSFYSLEHIVDDKKALKGMKTILQDKGFILILVPSRWSYLLYPRHGHRRYDVHCLKELAKQSNLSVEELVKLGGIATFVVHFVLVTMPDIIFRAKIRRIMHKYLRIERFFKAIKSPVCKFDQMCLWLEAGYAVILKRD